MASSPAAATITTRRGVVSTATKTSPGRTQAAAASDEDVHFSLIGAGSELERCKRIALDAGVRDRVRFHGQIEGAGNLLPAFDVLALTSWTEGTPMVLLEIGRAHV